MNRTLLILILVVATIVTYARVVGLEFVSWDDPDTIADNPRLNPPSVEGVGYYWRHAAGGLYIPVTYTWWSILATIGRVEREGSAAMNPRVFHAGNLLLHGISAVLVFLVLRQLIASDVAAWIGALLFALHPVQVESVAWASGAKDLLTGMFSLVMIDQYLRLCAKRQAGGEVPRDGGGAGYYVIALIAFVLAILSKPSAVVAPVIAAMLAWARYRTPVRPLLMSIAPMLLVSIVCVIWSRIAQPQFEPTDTPLWTRPFIAADAIAFYLWKLVWPANLAIIYGRTPSSVVESGAIFYTWIMVVLVALLAWWMVRRTQWGLVGFIVFIVALSPVLGFARFMFQIHSTVADHYLYLPMLGVAIAAAGLVSLKPNALVVGACCAMLAALAVVSVIQIGHWRDSESLYARALEVNPTSAFARGGLGRVYAEAGKIDQAIREFETAVDLVPTSRTARVYLAQAYLLAARYDQAIAEATAALRLAGAGENTEWERFILDQALSARQNEASTAPTTQP